MAGSSGSLPHGTEPTGHATIINPDELENYFSDTDEDLSDTESNTDAREKSESDDDKNFRVIFFENSWKIRGKF